MRNSYTSIFYNNNQDVNLLLGKDLKLNHVTAEKIQGSFNQADQATNKPDEVRGLLKKLAEEVAKIAAAQPEEQAQETAEHLEVLTKQSTSDKPNKSYWNVSKDGLIEAAQAVGAVGSVAVKLLGELGPYLGF